MRPISWTLAALALVALASAALAGEEKALVAAIGADAGDGHVSLTVTSWDGSTGTGYRVTADGDQIRVDVHPGPGRSWRNVWHSRLSDAQRERLSELLYAIPIDELDDDYLNPDFEDGTMLRFELPGPGVGAREIRVENMLVEALVPLTEALDEIVPERYRFRYRESIRSLERDGEALAGGAATPAGVSLYPLIRNVVRSTPVLPVAGS